MKPLIRILSHWQHVTALLCAIGLFFAAPYLLRLADPTAGAFDAGYLHRPVVAAVYLLFGVSAVWTVISLVFKAVDRWADGDGFDASLAQLSPSEQILAFTVLFFGLMASYLTCLWLVPV